MPLLVHAAITETIELGWVGMIEYNPEVLVATVSPFTIHVNANAPGHDTIAEN
jgi:hypothetical protein